MPKSIRRVTVVLATGLALLLSASPVLGYTAYKPTLSCTDGKTVNISSRASTHISHSWSAGGYEYWTNLNQDLKVSWTNRTSTWAILDYDSTYTSFSTYCVQ